MSVELLYTSAPQGLKQGSRGFSTVLCTNGLPINLATRLEGLSGYKHVFPPNSPQASSNPVCFSHLRFVVGGKAISILSRISDYGIDYSQRTNKLAHHVVLDTAEQPAAGPAWLLSQPGFMRSQWDGACKTLPAGPSVPQADQSPAICQTWQSTMGDAGWGGVVADAFISNNPKPLWIVYKLEQSGMLLKLINEAIALLPPHERWRATFSTYVTNLPPEADCKVRCVLEGSEEARQSSVRGNVISLIVPSAIGTPSDNILRARGEHVEAIEKKRPVSSVSASQFEFDPPADQQPEQQSSVRTKLTPPQPPSPSAAPPRIGGTRPSEPAVQTNAVGRSKLVVWSAVSVAATLFFIASLYVAYLAWRKQNRSLPPLASISTNSDLPTDATNTTTAVSNEDTGGEEKAKRDDKGVSEASSGDRKAESTETAKPDKTPETEPNKDLNDSPSSKPATGQDEKAPAVPEEKTSGPTETTDPTQNTTPDKEEKRETTQCVVQMNKLLNGSFSAKVKMALPVKELDKLWIRDNTRKQDQWGGALNWESKIVGAAEKSRGNLHNWEVQNGNLEFELNLDTPEFATFVREVNEGFEGLSVAIVNFNRHAAFMETPVPIQQLLRNSNPPIPFPFKLFTVDKDTFDPTLVNDMEKNDFVIECRKRLKTIEKEVRNFKAADSDKERIHKFQEELALLSDDFEMAVKAGKKLNSSLNKVEKLKFIEDDIVRVLEKSETKKSGGINIAKVVTEKLGTPVPIKCHFVFVEKISRSK